MTMMKISNSRDEIFKKDYLEPRDIMFLCGVCYQKATEIIKAIKRKTNDRLRVRGKCHIQDYFEYFNLDPAIYLNNHKGE